MENWDLCLNLINNGLFPIAMCGGLIYVVITLFKAYREDHKAITDAVNNNTLTMQKLCDRLDYGEKGDKK